MNINSKSESFLKRKTTPLIITDKNPPENALPFPAYLQNPPKMYIPYCSETNRNVTKNQSINYNNTYSIYRVLL